MGRAWHSYMIFYFPYMTSPLGETVKLKDPFGSKLRRMGICTKVEYMKRLGNVWDEFVSYENLYKAYKKARTNKGHRQSVLRFEEDVEGNLKRLQEELKDGTWHSSDYRFFEIHEYGKTRLIASLPFYPDRIVHWALMNVTHRRFEKNLIRQTFACTPGRGTHNALKYAKEYVSKDDAIYCLKTDMHKCFPSINKYLLMEKMERIIKDKKLLEMYSRIVYEYPLTGIPIGNYTSQFFANLYLSSIDHQMKEKYHCKYYLRYMDDIVILGWKKSWMHRVNRKLNNLSATNQMKIKKNWQIFPIEKRNLDFVGYVLNKDCTLLRKSTKMRMRHRVKNIESMNSHYKGRIASYHGLLIHCDGYWLHNKYLTRWIQWNI